MFGVAAESAKGMIGLTGGGWVLKLHEDLVNVGKLQQPGVSLKQFHASVLWNGEWVVSGVVLCEY